MYNNKSKRVFSIDYSNENILKIFKILKISKKKKKNYFAK